METFAVNAQLREKLGSRASRQLRHAGFVPAVLYGAGEAMQLSIKANELANHLEHEAFYSHVLSISVNGTTERAILRDLQRHPYKKEILHIDFLRVSEDQEIKVHVPLHFLNEDSCVGVKQQGGRVGHLQTEVEVVCLPRHLPEYIEVDIADLELGHSLHLSSIAMPEHVKLVSLMQGEEHDLPIVNVFMPRAAAEEVEESKEQEEEAAAAASEDGKKGEEGGESS